MGTDSCSSLLQCKYFGGYQQIAVFIYYSITFILSYWIVISIGDGGAWQKVNLRRTRNVNNWSAEPFLLRG